MKNLKRGDLMFYNNEGKVEVVAFCDKKNGNYILSTEKGAIVVPEENVFYTREEAEDAACNYINDKIDKFIFNNNITITADNEEAVRGCIENLLFAANSISENEIKAAISICA